MIVSPEIKVTNSLSKLEFYQIEYIDEFKENELESVLSMLITEDYQRLYFSFGRFDIFYEHNIEKKHKELFEKIESNGKIEPIIQQDNQKFAFTGFIELSRLQSIQIIIDIFKIYYSCSFEFFGESKINFKSYFDLMCSKYWENDHDHKRLYKNIEYKYSLFKGLGPNLIYLIYDNNFELPKWIKDKIPLPPKRATSLIGRIKEGLFGYPWVELDDTN